MSKSKSPRGLILVCYYTKGIEGILYLLNSFEKRTNQYHEQILVVDNSGFLKNCITLENRSLEIIQGTNVAWEFSGWLEGLIHVNSWQNFQSITLLNDSYLQNWNITFASKHLIKKMYVRADQGFIVGWKDVFSWYRKPYFSKRTNSRIVVLTPKKMPLIKQAIISSIDEAKVKYESGCPFFDKNEFKVINNWLNSQKGRWTNEATATRFQRIFIEHHLFDRVDQASIEFVPKTLLGCFIYSLNKRLFGEKR